MAGHQPISDEINASNTTPLRQYSAVSKHLKLIVNLMNDAVSPVLVLSCGYRALYVTTYADTDEEMPEILRKRAHCRSYCSILSSKSAWLEVWEAAVTR